MPNCGVCLKPTSGSDSYHRPCLQRLFGIGKFPKFDTIDLSTLYRQATEMAGKMSISGAQEKVSVALSTDQSELRIAATGGRYILKPEPARFPSVPQNEHVTMLMASLVGIETPPLGLVWLKDGSPAYLIKRFDRLDDGRKLQVEDFCQLSERPLKDKYQGSAEECVRILKRYASEPPIEVRKLFQVLLFSWWVANGDHHLKNLSLLTTPEGIRHLSPAYDLLCTRLAIPTDMDLSLSILGKKSKLKRASWLDFAAYCELPTRAAERLLSEQIAATEPAIRLVRSSFLSDEHKQEYIEILNLNTAVLSA
ncbi:MAG TPA: HipA domain-containing protein [Pirellulales bacterium]|nr:HipA domain-containing protein [Pirellulales bacterium]